MHKTYISSTPYLIRTTCGKVYDLFRAHWVCIKDETFVDHSLYLNPDGTYLYSTCNVFRDTTRPEKYEFISESKAREIFFSRLPEADRQFFFSKAKNGQSLAKAPLPIAATLA